MKTKITQIAIFTFLLTFSGVFAQYAEGGNDSSSFESKRNTDNLTINIPQNSSEALSPADITNRSSAAAELINYQAVARDAGGVLMTNQAVTIDFEIRDGAGGPAVYNETQNLNTDTNAVFSAQIGSVTPLTSVNWLNIDAWLQVDLNGTNVGETQIGSVPTALHSAQSGVVMIYGSGTNNPDKMVVSHSPSFPDWGIGYDDGSDVIDFMAGGTKTLNIDLGSGDLTTLGNLEVNETTTSPALNTVYGNSMPIAYGSISSSGGISAGYGIASVTSSGGGVYNIVLTHATETGNPIVSITPFTTGIGSPEIVGYQNVSANEFRVNIQTTGGVGTDSAFSFVVYGNH